MVLVGRGFSRDVKWPEKRALAPDALLSLQGWPFIRWSPVGSPIFQREANDDSATEATGGSSGIPDGNAFAARVFRRRSKRAERGIVQSATVASAHQHFDDVHH